MGLLAFLDKFALPRWRPAVSEYESAAAQAIERLADMVELMGDALFAIAGGMHTDDPAGQRNMAAVFKEDALNRYQDVLKKISPEQKRKMEDYIEGLCKGKSKR